jgi:disulfide bond formation protein DsbB
MGTDQVSVFFALLAFMALAVGVAVFVIVAFGKAEKLRPVADVLLPLAFMVALTSTLGSLYYSGIANFRPCRFCWWQRIMMYPMVPVLGIATFRKDVMGAWYAVPLALGGLGFGAYHTQLRWWPDDSGSCDIDAPCSAVWVDTWGFVSIPFMATCGFVAISGLLTARLMLNRAAAA